MTLLVNKNLSQASLLNTDGERGRQIFAVFCVRGVNPLLRVSWVRFLFLLECVLLLAQASLGSGVVFLREIFNNVLLCFV